MIEQQTVVVAAAAVCVQHVAAAAVAELAGMLLVLHGGVAIVLAGEVLQVVLVLIEQSTQSVFSDNIGHAVLAGGQSGGVRSRHRRRR